MTWPNVLPNSGAFDADADSVAASRPELKKMSDAVNSIVDFVNPTGIGEGQFLYYDPDSSNGRLIVIDGTMPVNFNSTPIKNYRDVVYTGLPTTGTITPDVANGSVQRITLTGNLTMNAFANAKAGQTLTIIFKQPAAGSTYDLTSTMNWENGRESLTQINSAVDVANIVYDGTNYYAYMGLAYGSVEVYAQDVSPLTQDLDVNNYNIVNNVTNGNITLQPNGTGDVYMNADTLRVGDSNATANIQSNGTGNLILRSYTSGPNITLSYNTGTISLNQTGAGYVAISGFRYPTTDGTNGQVLTTNGSGVLSFTNAGTGLTDIVNDTTPQLGGNLDVNGYTITSASNANVVIEPNGAGDILLKTDNITVGESTGNVLLSTPFANTTGKLIISLNQNTGSNANITIDPASTGGEELSFFSSTNMFFSAKQKYIFDAPGTISSAGDADDVIITTDGLTDLVLNTNEGANSGSITILDGVNGNIEIIPNGTGAIVCNDKIIRQVEFKDYAETVYNQGNVTGSFSITVSNGNTQRMRLTGSVTFTGFTDAREGQTVTLLITQDGTGGRTFTEGLDSAGRMLFAGGVSTLSTGANATDIMSISYIGGTYWSIINKNYS